MSALPLKADIPGRNVNVSFGPCVDGSELARTFFTSAALVGAATCSAFACGSHDRWPNTLRGSDPGQKHAFDDAVAHVGCPDRRMMVLKIRNVRSHAMSHCRIQISIY
jgi:hypothetical protein